MLWQAMGPASPMARSRIATPPACSMLRAAATARAAARRFALLWLAGMGQPAMARAMAQADSRFLTLARTGTALPPGQAAPSPAPLARVGILFARKFLLQIC